MGYYSLFLCLLMIFVAKTSQAQTVNFEDGFEDGNFTYNPVWTGDDSLFTVSELAGNNLLQLAGSAGENPAYLSTPSVKVSGYWEFYFKYNASTPPSGSNKATVFLMSDRANLEGAVNGYAVQIGEAGDDFFKIVRYDEGQALTILTDSTIIKNNESGYRVKVIRSIGGRWQIEVGNGYSGKLINSGNTITDNTYHSSSHFGLLVDYTSSRSDSFFFDFSIDLPPFMVDGVHISGKKSIDIAFNRPFEPASITATDFLLNNGWGHPQSLEFPASNTIRIHYPSALPSAKYVLSIDGIHDFSKNKLRATNKAFIVFGTYTAGDIKINEFLYDPPPVLAEYVEIINTSSNYLKLGDWKVGDNLNLYSLSNNAYIAPDSFLVLTSDTAALAESFGRGAYLKSNLPAFNNSGDAIRLITSSGITADSLSYAPNWGGDDAALERRSLITPSIYKENWVVSTHPKGGTPGMINRAKPDLKPPQLNEISVISNKAIQLQFNERLELGSAVKGSNYEVPNAEFETIGLISPQSVRLSFQEAFRNAETYDISISGVKDIFGNTVRSIDTSFTYYEISTADSGDVFITEFNYDPKPGYTEYIEIYNPSTKSLNLRNWTLSDNRGQRSMITSSPFILPPETFVVIAPDNTLLLDYPDILLISMPAFPSLNNSGDNIVLRNATGMLMDSLQYTSSWGGSEGALERRTNDVSAYFSENWSDAPNGFGSPGSANGVVADETPPALTEVIIHDASTLQLIFSERITSSTAVDRSHYHLSPSIGIQLIASADNSATLFLNEDLVTGKIYEITVSNISDLFGNKLEEASRQLEYLDLTKAKRGEIVINEFSSHAIGDHSAEFIELFNPTDQNFDLSYWFIGDGSNKISLGSHVYLRAKSYLVLTGNKNLARSLRNAVSLASFPSLNNNGDAIYLQNKLENTVDSLYYSAAWGLVDNRSIERKDPFAASNDASNWQIHKTAAAHSAGTKNSRYQPDYSPPKAIFSKILPSDEIEIRFNEFIQLTENLQFFADGVQLSIVSFDSANANIARLVPPTKTAINFKKLTIRNLTDVKGNQTPKSEIAVAQPLQAADLVINEIMFNPLNDPDDNRSDQSEYIELRNTQDHAISLEGLVLHDAPDEDGNLRELHPLSTTAKWVPPEGLVLIYADEIPSYQWSSIATFFDLKIPNRQALLRVDRSSLSLASTDDAIFIADSSGLTIDSVFYDESWHNPNLIDRRGIALERISPAGPSNDETNWSSSIHAKGGTPNSENSIYQQNITTKNRSGISFSPNPFSPDGDGHEDNLFINYQLDHPDYLIKVQIYDRYGRFITELADGKQAGFEGTLIWDGRKNDGSRNRIGIYIVIFEAYNSASGENKAFKKVVVLARRLN